MEDISTENEGQSLQNEISRDGLDSKVKEVMETIKKLEAEKQQTQEEFGIQRARLKELYMKKEEELMRESQERIRLQELTDRLQHELNETKSQLLLASFRRESDIAQEKRKRQEEVASLEKLMQEAVEEASLSQKKFKDEIRRLQKMNERLDSELSDAHRPSGDQGPRLPLGGAVAALAPITAYTKSIARKVGSLGPALGPGLSSNSSASQITSPSTASTCLPTSHNHPNVGDSNAVASSLTSSEENLEEGMRKVKKYAQEDAEVLRSLVIPLEEEIEALKDKLRNAYHILKSYGYEDGKTTWKAILNEKRVSENNNWLHSHHQDSSVKEHEEIPLVKKNEQNLADNVTIDQSDMLPREDGSAAIAQLPNGSPSTKLSQDFLRLNTNATGQEPLQRSPSHPEAIVGFDHSNYECSSEDKQPLPLTSVCHMCANYEAQLQKMQEEVRELEKKRKIADRASERYREELVKETEFRKDMEEKWNEKKEQHKNQVLELKGQMETSEKGVQELRLTFNKVYKEMKLRLERLTNEREEVGRELIRLQNENDKLVGKHSAHSQVLQNETINLPDKVEELQELLLKFREEVISAKVGKEAAEETEKTLREECLNFYEQIRIEQEKSSELQDVVQKQKQELAHLQSMENNLQQQLTEASKKLEEVLIVKKESETTLAELRNRVSGLHKELDVSVKVQQDLVQLSQSLQVQLEHIRESEKEVRWQHEDDVEVCAGCRNHFSSPTNKNHCNHCGRIFCPMCLSQTVTSGPNHRQYSVCKVCHTLLVREKPLIFSSETTDLPD